MAWSRTLEPDPGHAGVGTENAHATAPLSLLRFTWISVLSRFGDRHALLFGCFWQHRRLGQNPA
jgi:hypothetical protein